MIGRFPEVVKVTDKFVTSVREVFVVVKMPEEAETTTPLGPTSLVLSLLSTDSKEAFAKFAETVAEPVLEMFTPPFLKTVATDPFAGVPASQEETVMVSVPSFTELTTPRDPPADTTSPAIMLDRFQVSASTTVVLENVVLELEVNKVVSAMVKMSKSVIFILEF